MNANNYFTAQDHVEATKSLLGGLLMRLESDVAYAKYQADLAVILPVTRAFVARLKKANSVTLARRLERLTGEVTFNPWQERQDVIAKLFSLALRNGEIQRIPTSPRLEAYGMRMVLGMPTLEETQRSQGTMSREDVLKVVELRNLGLTYREISQVVGVSDNMCCAIATGMSYTHWTGLTYTKRAA